MPLPDHVWPQEVSPPLLSTQNGPLSKLTMTMQFKVHFTLDGFSLIKGTNLVFLQFVKLLTIMYGY